MSEAMAQAAGLDNYASEGNGMTCLGRTAIG